MTVNGLNAFFYKVKKIVYNAPVKATEVLLSL